MSIRRVVAVVALSGALASGGSAGVAATPDDPTPTPPTVPPLTTVLDNEFIPEDANLSECISSLPRPECGSDARGGWRQTLIFAVLAVVLAIGGWRLISIVRRRDRAGVEQVEQIDADRAARDDRQPR